MLSSIESPDDWNAICGQFADAEFTQSHGWGEARRPEGWRPVRLVLHDAGVACAGAQFLMKERHGLRLLYCPRGPFWVRRGFAPGDRLAYLTLFLDAVVAQYPRAALVCDWHVDRGDLPETAIRSLGFRLVSPSLTAVIDLRSEASAIRSAFHRKWRNDLQKGEQSSLDIRRYDAPDHLDALYALAGVTATRKGFVVGVSREVAERFVAASVPGTASVFTATAPEGTLVSAALMVTFNQTTHYLVGASVPKDDPAFHRGASNLIQWTALQWAKGAGSLDYNLEGLDLAGNPGVYHFKDRMNGRMVHRRGVWVRTGNRLATALLQRVLRRRMP